MRYPRPSKYQLINTSRPKLDFVLAVFYILFVVGISFALTLSSVKYVYSLVHVKDVFTMLLLVSALTGSIVAMIVLSFLQLESVYMNLLVFVIVILGVSSGIAYANLEFFKKSYYSG